GEVQPAFPGGVAAGALHAGGVGVGVQGGAAAGAVPAQRGAAADPLAGGFEVADVVAQGCVDAADVSGELVDARVVVARGVHPGFEPAGQCGDDRQWQVVAGAPVVGDPVPHPEVEHGGDGQVADLVRVPAECGPPAGPLDGDRAGPGGAGQVDHVQ